MALGNTVMGGGGQVGSGSRARVAGRGRAAADGQEQARRAGSGDPGTRGGTAPPRVPSGGRNWREALGQTAPGSREGAEGGDGATPHPEGKGGAARGAQRREERGVPGGFAPREPPAPRIPLSLSSPGNQRRKGVHRWAPGLFPAPLADMAADELSPGSLGSPAARVEETPLPSRPASLGSPLPAGPPATAEHRARAAREDARRADDHRVHSLEGPSSSVSPWPEAEVREEPGEVVRVRGL